MQLNTIKFGSENSLTDLTVFQQLNVPMPAAFYTKSTSWMREYSDTPVEDSVIFPFTSKIHYFLCNSFLIWKYDQYFAAGYIFFIILIFLMYKITKEHIIKYSFSE